jgi:hypothetical protein
LFAATVAARDGFEIKSNVQKKSTIVKRVKTKIVYPLLL